MSSQKKRPFKRKLLGLATVVILFFGAFFLTYSHYEKPPLLLSISSFYSGIKTAMTERNRPLHHNAVVIKTVGVDQQNTETPIQFEFYTSLPNMPLIAPDLNLPKDRKDKILATKTHTMHANIVNADELEQDMANQIRKSPK